MVSPKFAKPEACAILCAIAIGTGFINLYDIAQLRKERARVDIKVSADGSRLTLSGNALAASSDLSALNKAVEDGKAEPPPSVSVGITPADREWGGSRFDYEKQKTKVVPLTFEAVKKCNPDTVDPSSRIRTAFEDLPDGTEAYIVALRSFNGKLYVDTKEKTSSHMTFMNDTLIKKLRGAVLVDCTKPPYIVVETSAELIPEYVPVVGMFKSNLVK